MARKHKQAETAQAPPQPIGEPSGGAKCSLCGVALHGQVATICILCLATRTRRCYECVNHTGRIKQAYRFHRYEASGAAFRPDGKPIPEDERGCVICHDAGPHEAMAKKCPTCGGKRYVIAEGAVGHA